MAKQDQAYQTVQLIKMEPLGTSSYGAVKPLEYQRVQLIKTKPLGTGSYGAVYKAMCDDLPCAGKILHPTLFQSNDPGAMTITKQFQRECNFLSAIRHPNIVQYLGLYQDPETRLQVLLMELMDDNLTRFLEQSQEPLPYHTQVNISHDIALALAYLHSNDIIHRDLSSNNVLLMGAGNRAKVTDFGMAKLFIQTAMTKCPGTEVYMSPEALDDPAGYTQKLDTFSFGVLGIQIITRQFPNPGPRTKKVQDPRESNRRLQEVVPETERRKSHIDLIDPTHPLLPIATDCLSYNEKDRPSAQDLCHCLAALRGAQQYSDSVQQAQERSRLTQRAREDRERQIRKLQQEKEELQQELHVSGSQIREKNAEIAAAQEAIQLLTQENQEKDQELNQLKASESMISVLQQREEMIELQEEVQHLRQVLQKKDNAVQLSLTWRTCETALCRMRRGSTAVCGSIAYFGCVRTVHSYNSGTEEWSILPEYPTMNFALAVVNGFVTGVGGRHLPSHACNFTNKLLSLKEEDGESKWMKHFPPMPTKRECTAVVCSGKALVVAGGVGWGPNALSIQTDITVATVEVMDTDTRVWSTVSNLPHPRYQASATICGDRVYLVGGKSRYDYWKTSVFTCSLSALLQSQKNHPIWHTIADLPAKCSTCITLNGQLLAVGGSRQLITTNNIYSYNTTTNSWNIISQMPTPRYGCLVTVLPDNKLLVVGGETSIRVRDTAEIATLLNQ